MAKEDWKVKIPTLGGPGSIVNTGNHTIKSGNRYSIQIGFYALWTILAIVQAYFTPLLGDEAYYWRYSQDMDWGYFDHPPVLAFAIRLGYWIFPNELGLRLVPMLMVTGSIYCLELLIRPQNLKWFYGVIASVGILSFVGFLAIPDAPLLFFAALFLLLYKRFLQAPAWGLSVALGATGGLMILSKYHAFLFIGLLILSHLKILKDFRFWLALVIALAAITPHILWQVDHEFPSVRYHLFERSVSGYSFDDSLQYILLQPLVLGPVTGILFLIAVYRHKAKNGFERSMKVLFWGGYLFFFLMTFKGRVEAHWTLMCLLPGMYFGYRFVESSTRVRKILLWTIPFALFLIGAARIALILQLIPQEWSKGSAQSFFLDKAQWAAEIEEIAGEHPVLFMNSYSCAALYQFYTDKPSASLNNISGRKNQYDIWGYEESFLGKDVIVVINYPHPDAPLVPGLNLRKRQYQLVEDFQIYAGLQMETIALQNKGKPKEALAVELKALPLKLSKESTEQLDNISSCLTYQLFSGNKMIYDWPTPIYFDSKSLSNPLKFHVLAPPKPGKYGLHFSVQTEWLPPGINSPRYEITIED